MVLREHSTDPRVPKGPLARRGDRRVSAGGRAAAPEPPRTRERGAELARERLARSVAADAIGSDHDVVEPDAAGPASGELEVAEAERLVGDRTVARGVDEQRAVGEDLHVARPPVIEGLHAVPGVGR